MRSSGEWGVCLSKDHVNSFLIIDPGIAFSCALDITKHF